MYVLFGQFDVQPEHRVAFIEALIADGRGSCRDEPGTLRLDIIQDADDPCRIYVYEVYTGEAAFTAHLQGPHYQRVLEISRDWFAAPIKMVAHGASIWPPDDDSAWRK